MVCKQEREATSLLPPDLARRGDIREEAKINNMEAWKEGVSLERAGFNGSEEAEFR